MAAVLFAYFLNGIMTQSADRRELIRRLKLPRSWRRLNGVKESCKSVRGSREIHDTLAQDFISVITHLEDGRTKPA